MRDDQIQRLTELEEELIDVYLEEADPKAWPGAGMPIADMSREQRGDRVWSKRNAAASVMLAMETRKLIANDKQALGRDPHTEDEMDKKIKDAEKRAQKLLDKVGQETARATFLKRSTGDE